MERGFLASGDKKKKEGVSKVAVKEKKDGASLMAGESAKLNDDTPILSGIAKRVTCIDGNITVPKSILRKPLRKIVNEEVGAATQGIEGRSPSKVSFEAVGNLNINNVAADPNSTNSGGSFASLLKPKDVTNKVLFRTLVNEECVESVDCVLPKSAAAKVKGRYENSIVGFFLGKDPSFPVVKQYVTNTWRKFGFERITRNDDGVYLFKFSTKAGRDQVMEKGPWLIRKSPIILSKWSSSVSLKRGEVTKVPVWVKMYNVPVLAYSEDGLSLIGTQIGKPIMLDAFTSSMCVESWGRISFARALIEIDAAVGLKKEVIMAIPEEEGDGYIKEIVRVEFEWKPPHCVECRSFGHDTLLCPKRIRVEVPNNSARVDKTTVMEENEDGFTEVKSRKKKKGADFGGIRLNKPKSKVMWQQKKSVEPSNSSNVVGNDKNESNPGLNTSNPFDVLNVDGDALDETGTQQKVSDVSSSDLNVKKVDASKPSCSKSDHSDSHKDMNVRSPTEWKKWDVINEDDTTDDEAVFAPNGGSLGGGNELEGDDFDFYEGYANQVIGLDDALKEYRDFKLSMSGRK